MVNGCMHAYSKGFFPKTFTPLESKERTTSPGASDGANPLRCGSRRRRTRQRQRHLRHAPTGQPLAFRLARPAIFAPSLPTASAAGADGARQSSRRGARATLTPRAVLRTQWHHVSLAMHAPRLPSRARLHASPSTAHFSRHVSHDNFSVTGAPRTHLGGLVCSQVPRSAVPAPGAHRQHPGPLGLPEGVVLLWRRQHQLGKGLG